MTKSGKIKSITIPSTVTSLGSAFVYCYDLESVVIPDGVTELAQYLFRDCTALKTVTIEGCPDVKVYAFKNCTALTDIYCKTATPPNCLSTLVFYGTDAANTATLHIPTGSRDAYASATVWEDFLNVVEEDYTDSNSEDNDEGAVASAEVDCNVVSEEFFTVSGTQVAKPIDSEKAIYIVVRTYEDGFVKTIKEVH